MAKEVRPRLVELAKGHYRLEGRFYYGVAGTLADCPLSNNDGHCRVDLDGLERVDSSLLALLLRWLRRERKRGVALRFSGFSDQLTSLIDLYDLRPLLLSGD